MLQRDIWQWLAICETCKTGHQKHRIFCFLKFYLKNVFKIFLEKVSGQCNGFISLNTSPRSAINFMTEIKRCETLWRACFQLQIPILIRKYAHLVVSAHISIQVQHLKQVCEGEKQSQLLPTTSLLWFLRRISLVVPFHWPISVFSVVWNIMF